MARFRIYNDENINHVRKHRDIFKLKYEILRRAIHDDDYRKKHLIDLAYKLEGKTITEMKRTINSRLWVGGIPY